MRMFIFVILRKCDDQLAFELVENAALFKQKFSSAYGFEFDKQCIPAGSKPGNGAPRGELQCCGENPSRFPYHDQNGGRQCCVDKVFSTDKLQCCDNGSLIGADKSC